MGDSIRAQLVEAVKARFEAITVNNGYETDLGASRVFVFREAEPEETENIFINIQDIKQTRNENPQPNIWEMTLDFEVMIYVLGEQLTETIAEQVRTAICDLIKAIGVQTNGMDGRRWGGLANDTQYTDDEEALDHQEKVTGIGAVRFSIIFRHKAFNPYEQ